MNEIVSSVKGISMVKIESYLLDRPKPDYEIASLLMESINAYSQKISEMYLLNQFLEKADTERENLERNNRSLTELVSMLQDGMKEKTAEIERLKLITTSNPYCVRIGTADIYTENHEEYERLLASISAEAIKECLDWVLSLFPEDKNFTTISRFTIKQKLKEMVGDSNV